ncbi:MAG: phosphodiester glycosidase family protein [Cyanobacteria bacterium SZAS LIN-5]|nr:phosphodiester glycosidase family protein [Cyanobacteria bacterium SZAS LIN-5]
MNGSNKKIEQIANNITTFVLSVIIVVVAVGFWNYSSKTFKQDCFTAVATMLSKTLDFVAHPFAKKDSGQEHTVISQSAQENWYGDSATTDNTGSKSKSTRVLHKESTEPDQAEKAKLASMPAPPFASPSLPKKEKVVRHGKPVQFVRKTVSHVPVYETIIDLHDPETFISIGLANNAFLANDKDMTHGDEGFDSLVKKSHASVVMNGTFFSKDDQKRVMGNMVSGGRFLKYSPWENYGTTFGLTRNNRPVMMTARAGELPNWSEHWFSLTCGPRLLKDGEVWIYPEKEGFADSHVLGVGPRCALGFNPTGDKLILCTFMNGLSLSEEARLMKELGCSEAMNLDGGASRSLAHNGSIVVPAGRPLTNVLLVYDSKNKAPQSLINSWETFQQIER